MDISLIPPHQLTESLLAAWRGITPDTPPYDSPFYDPAFTLAVARVREDVEIAVLADQGREVGFLPFQRAAGRTGYPVGWKINDFQGAVSAAGVQPDPVELLRACGLIRWRFNHLPIDQAWCGTAQVNRAASHTIDLADGFEQYLAGKLSQGGTFFKSLRRKQRKMQRELGPLRFELDAADPALFEMLLRWKADHLRHTRRPNVWSDRWAYNTLKHLRGGEEPGCRGLLSALYCGEHPVALHFGIRSRRCLHYWISAYNAETKRYSPGGVLLLNLAEAAAAAGMHRIDLGKGTEDYKRRFMTGAIPLAEGAVACNRWRQVRERLAYRAAERIRGSAWMHPAWRWAKQVRRRVVGSRKAVG